MNARIGDWVATYTGKSFFPLDPRKEEVDIRDIAHSLAMTPRYNGHCKFHYSVAQHCVHLYDLAPPALKFPILMHDASEAYLGDVPRPLKPFLVGYKEIEDKLQGFLSRVFELPYPHSPELILMDASICVVEQRDVMNPSDREWTGLNGLVAPDIKIERMEIVDVKREFLLRFAKHRPFTWHSLSG